MSSGEKPAVFRHERLIAAVVVGLLAVALAFSEFGRYRQGELLAKEVKTAKADATAALEAVIAPATLSAAEASVYYVEGSNGSATAFVIDRERGLLATAAHVAEVLDLDDEDDPPVVVNRHTGAPLRIIARRSHSGYGALGRAAEAYQPIDPESAVLFPEVVPIYDAAFDGAILFVDPIDPETGENRLGPSLPLASRQTLLALKVGDPIAVVSYPSTVMWSNAGDEEVASRAERGTIAAMRAPIDGIAESANPVFRNLIAHRMSTAPGSSGAPLFNGRGEVVGIESDGNAAEGLAQRADIIHDLLTALEEETAVADVYGPEWKKRLSRWLKAKDAIPYSLYRRYGPMDPPGDDETLGNVDWDADRPFEVITADLTLGTMMSRGMIHAPADLTRDELPEAASERTLGSEDREGPVAAERTPAFRFAKPGRYNITSVFVEPGMDHVVFAFDYNLGTNNAGYCAIGFYHRRKGEAVFEEVGATRIPRIRIPASRSGDHEFVFRRPKNCGSTGGQFFLGLLAWEAEEAGDAEKPPLSLAALTPAALSARVVGAGARVRNFGACRLGGEACIAPVRASLHAVAATDDAGVD